MFKALTIIPALAASALSLAGCPPADGSPNADVPGCVRNITIIPEPDREILNVMSKVCTINVYMDPDFAHGGWPYTRCIKYWHGHFDIDQYMCVDVHL